LKQQPNPSQHLQWVDKNFAWLVTSSTITFLGTLATLFYIIHWNLILVGVGLFAAIICVFYVVRIRGKNLRELPLIKIHLITIIWVVVISFFPLLNEQNFTQQHWVFGIAHYAYILAICIPFDIRDLNYDLPKQKTIPQLLGLQSSKMIAMLLLVSFILISVSFQERLASNNFFLIAVLVQLLLVYFTTKKSSDFYFGVLIDGAILLLGFSYFF